MEVYHYTTHWCGSRFHSLFMEEPSFRNPPYTPRSWSTLTVTDFGLKDEGIRARCMLSVIDQPNENLLGSRFFNNGLNPGKLVVGYYLDDTSVSRTGKAPGIVTRSDYGRNDAWMGSR